ncbi:benzoate/H(+) symporter BenE family transporter [Neorhizobium petrolearium]|uniref:Benzoate/H(+) symporter BenE family transporter n=1 Tax=Neorhizobium petrolearium TaxID=515361 RepID=A0ABY8M8Q5_9HYPH|nr:benzoate/H(+) symporter BenE family transporter [Neorhizobium petrolearium]MCC2610710.1 benzoate/H(+) symporter BenE family transporter [Neorhizobium petrolearium]WGI70837.1 benzoate/H(+) symporter BenE family transporter [Neorhizobium petrolearium]
MLKDFSVSALMMGLLTAFVGFVSSFAVIMQGLQAMGATAPEIASALLAQSVSMGLLAIVFSAWFRMPISIAWSTPGAALLAGISVIEGGFPAVVGAFVVCGALIVLSGLFRPLGRVIRMIPAPLANAMLAGILLSLCLAPVKAVAFNAALGLPIVLTWMVVVSRWRLWAVPAALVALVLVLIFGVELPADTMEQIGAAIHPDLTFIEPVFTWSGIVSVAVPLFIVTMASQNIPGIAILKVHHYEPPPGLLFAGTGIFSILGGLTGGVPVNMAAITAAMCASEDAHPDPAKRYWAAIVGGFGYIGLGLVAGGIIAFVSLAPPILLQAVAGLGLVNAFSSAAFAAYREPETREAAAITFLVTASGASFAGISGAFWGLVAGGAMMALRHFMQSPKK